ncbi:MAG: hypothetical protein A3F11_07395 [Gammaproteobacteria bacterium RIFCSPHIGHO2_12_FULL_37_14]|nr:MAG: hypothetical protein A3F11_07395 [Gammaproteobacteria bacterium RIFCSPHIGHO2_12_FULL_37_14]
MKGIILAAGRGSRMHELTQDKPKCMVKLKNKPLLDYQVAALKFADINEIGIVCGYQKEKIFNQHITRRFENRRWEHSNMVRSLIAASEWLKNDTCMVSYSDIFYEPLAIPLLMTAKTSIAILYDSNFKTLWSQRFTRPLSDLETFRVDSLHILQDIGSRAQTIDEIQGQYMGLLKFTPEGWQTVNLLLKTLDEHQVDNLDMTGLLKHLLLTDIKIQALPFSGTWGEVDSPTDLTLYETWMHC